MRYAATLGEALVAQVPVNSVVTVMFVLFGVTFCLFLLIVIVRLIVVARNPHARVRRGLTRPGGIWPIPGVEPRLPGDPTDPLHMHGHGPAVHHHPQTDTGTATPDPHGSGHHHHHDHGAGGCGGHHHGHSSDAGGHTGGHTGGFDAGGHSGGFDAGGHSGGHH